MSSARSISAGMPPRISIVTPSYNQAAFIEQTIRSVLAQNYPDFEHIVIDGGSTDGTVDILKKYPHLKWISEKDNGQSDALNKGLRLASGDIIAWINSDDWYESGVFEVIAAYFETHPDRNIVMGDCNLVDEKGNIFDKVINYERGFGELKNHWVPRSIPTQPAVFFRKRLLHEHGYLDETLHFAMDYDLWMRFAKNNHFYHIDRTVANYRFHTSAKGGDQDWSKFIPDCMNVYNRYCKPVISVIIPCYNYARYLSESVKSVLNQTYQDFEIIIVNDGSTDNTIEVAEQLIHDFPQYMIRLINQHNTGNPAFSRNKGIYEARGEYILPLDADDMLAPTMLAECLMLLTTDPSLSIAYTDRFDFGTVQQVVTARDYDFSLLKYQNHISYCALFKKGVWEAVGGYKPLGCEDWNFWVEAGSLGFIARRIPQPLFFYRNHTTGRFGHASAHFERMTAEIILQNKKLYTDSDVRHAIRVLDGCTPVVSVIMPTYNRPAMLRAAIQSVLSQTFQDFEIIVVNDAGEDVEYVINAIKSPKIRYLRHETNKGLAAARNTGILAACGKYIAYLDDDDLYYPDHLETLIGFLEESDYKVAYTDACKGIQQKRDDTFVTMYREEFPSQDFDNDAILVDNFLPVLCVIHAKGCLDVCGAFDESLPRHEDWDLWIRMSQSFPFAHVKRITCEFTYRPDGYGMTSSTVPMFLETYRKIYSKYASLVQGRSDIQVRQHINFFKATTRTFDFLKARVQPYLCQTPDETVMSSLTATGATIPQIKSVLDWQMGTTAHPPSSLLLEQALVSAPENHPARLDLIALYLNQRRFKDAFEHLEVLQQFSPDESTVAQIATHVTEEPAKEGYPGKGESNCSSPLKVAVFTLDLPEQACARLRLIDPLKAAQGIEILWGVTINGPNYTTDLNLIQAADLIVVQRFYPRKATLPYLEWMFNSGKPVIYEIDDLLAEVPDANHLKAWIQETADLLPELLPRFAAVTVSTEPLKKKLAPYAEEIHVLPNRLNAELWSGATPEKHSGPLRIGFCGTPTHTAELELIEPALGRIASEYGNAVSFVFMGCANEALSRLPGFRFLAFENSYDDYAEKLQGLALDIALVPLLDNSFNSCKSNIKWLEYSACGVAGLYADLPPYNTTVEHGRTGLLVGQDPEQWYRAIRFLMEREDLRRDIAAAARSRVLDEHSLRPGEITRERKFNHNGDYGQFLCRWHGRWQIGHPTSRPLVSVVIPVFNQMAYTRKCLETLFSSSQALAGRMEVIVVDNGSDDGTEGYLKTLTTGIRVVRHRQNQGFAKGCNSGALVANGSYLVFLNNDTEPRSGWLEALLAIFESNPAAGVVGSKLLFPDGTIQHAGVAIVRDPYLPAELSPCHIGYQQNDGPEYSRIMECSAVTAACCMIERWLFARVGGFDEGYWNGFEDIDLCFKVHMAGYRAVFQPASVVIHHESKSGPERKRTEQGNLQRLQDRWVGKISPEYVRVSPERVERIG